MEPKRELQQGENKNILTDRETKIFESAQTRAREEGSPSKMSFYVAKEIAQQNGNVAILTDDVVNFEIEFCNSSSGRMSRSQRNYDLRELVAPTINNISTLPLNELPQHFNLNEANFDLDQISAGRNGKGIKIDYHGRHYFLKAGANLGNAISDKNGYCSLNEPTTTPALETLYINLFGGDTRLTKHVPRACVVLAQKPVENLTDITEEGVDLLIQPESFADLQKVEGSRTLIIMDFLPVENPFDKLEVVEKLRHYKTILEFHRVAAENLISLKDDKSESYCIETETNTLKKYDFGECANFKHKPEELAKDIIINLLENIKGGLYNPNVKLNRTGMGSLSDFSFNEISLRAQRYLKDNPKGIVFYIKSRQLLNNNNGPKDIIDTFDQTLEALRQASSLSPNQRDETYLRLQKQDQLTDGEIIELLLMLETEQNNELINKAVAQRVGEINRYLDRTIYTENPSIDSISPGKPVLSEHQPVVDEADFLDIGSRAVLIEKIKELDIRSGIQTDVSRVRVALNLISRWTGINTYEKLKDLSRDELLAKIPEAIPLIDRFETFVVLKKLILLEKEEQINISKKSNV